MIITRSRRISRLSKVAGAVTASVLVCLGLTALPAGASVPAGVGIAAVSRPGAVPAIPPTSGYPNNMQFQHSGKCIDVPGAVTTNVQLTQYTCVYQTNEYWYLDPVNSDGTVFRIRSGSSGKCMNVQGASSANSAAIIQYPCGAYGNEYWEAASVGGDYYLVFSWAHPDKCLNIQGASKANGGKLIQYSCGSYANEYIHFY